MATINLEGDAREWNEDAYRRSILRDRERAARTVFRTAFAPSERHKPEIIVAASSDGSIACYSLESCICSASQVRNGVDVLMAEPVAVIEGHKGPVYDLKFYDDGKEALLFSCGDDGRIRGWKWLDVLNSEVPVAIQGSHLKPVLDLVNPQHEGPWSAQSPVPENNAIAINKQEGCIISATGDACAYCWDVETGKRKMVFRGHSDYLHCVVARESSNQIITGSEDGSARIWDCRNGLCTQVINPEKGRKLKETSWVSCLAIDASESWLHILAVGSEPILRRYSINGKALSKIQCAPQSAFSVSYHSSGITAVGGYGGLVDVVSEFGSHLCVFCCRGLDKDIFT
ncbi:WD40 repeat protein [Dioscorea alata]|uniref:WD40 repeat protein n=1 Tax=Dioscorea alata TaxID=55571 RepID=A0ACB7WFA2_DIOAL|nr:WD40 repeat protein [Dioscorea alata]